MALYREISELFNVEKCLDLEIGVKGHLRLLKVVPFDRLCMVSYSCSFVTLSLKRTGFEIFDLEVHSDLETRVRSRLGSSKIPFDPARSIVTIGLSRTVSEINRDFRRKSQIFPTPCI